jgi:hypothetical protein
LLPGSRPPAYVPLGDIQGLRHVDLKNIPEDVKEKVHLLELGKIPSPVLKVDHDYVLIDEPENIRAWLICRVAQISAVYVQQSTGAAVSTRTRMTRPVTPAFLDEAQLDLPEEAQNILLGQPQQRAEEEEEEPEEYPEEEVEDDFIDDEPEPDRV